MNAFGRFIAAWIAVVAILLASPLDAQNQAPTAKAVTVRDSGAKTSTGSWKEGHKDHKFQEQTIVLDSGKVCYTLKYRSCVDPSHPGVCANEEGYIGMPTPSSANWYHSGFFFITLNGKDVGLVPLTDMRITEAGARGGCHMVWDTPDATVRVQFLVAAGSDRLLSQLSWTAKPEHKVDSVSVRLTCYPSFFTSHHRRQGDRTVTTPRIEKREPESLDLVPSEDTYLLYTDGVFDVAKKEGDGPCGLMFLPEEIASGKVSISNYPVQTTLQAVPSTQRLRFAFWDFFGKTNADVKAYMKENGMKIQQELRQTEFRPECVLRFDPVAAKAQLDQLLTSSLEDGAKLKPTVEKLLQQMTELKVKSEAGVWNADADFAKLQPELEAMTWKLKIFALLNAP